MRSTLNKLLSLQYNIVNYKHNSSPPELAQLELAFLFFNSVNLNLNIYGSMGAGGVI